MMFQSVVFFECFSYPPKIQNLPGKKIQDSQPENQPFQVPLPEVKFEGAGDNKGLCCSFENGVCGFRSGSLFAELGLLFFFFQSKCSKIQKGDFFKNISVGKGGGDSKPCNCRRVLLGAFGRLRRHRNHGSQALKRRSLRNH